MAEKMKGYVKAGRVIRLLAWIQLILLIVTGAAIGIPMFMAPDFPIEPNARLFLAAIWVVMGGLAWFFIHLGKSVMEHKEWARVTAVIFYFIALFSFPIGTLIGGYIIYHLIRNWDADAS